MQVAVTTRQATPVRDSGRSADRTLGALGAGAAGALALILLGIAASVLRLAWPAITSNGTFWSIEWDPARGKIGGLSFLFGTVVSSLVAVLLAVPVGLGVALFLSDLGPRSLRRFVASVVDLLAAIPSVVYGLWAALVLAPAIRDTLPSSTSGIFAGPNLGVGLLCASLVLAIMILPTIAAVTRDILRAVPAELREGALALGATPWDVVRFVVVPHAKRGIMGAVLLGLGRAVGETMAVAAVVGSRADIGLSLFAPGYTMSSVIANEFPAASTDLHVAALAEVGVALFLVTVAFNVAARVLVRARA